MKEQTKTYKKGIIFVIIIIIFLVGIYFIINNKKEIDNKESLETKEDNVDDATEKDENDVDDSTKTDENTVDENLDIKSKEECEKLNEWLIHKDSSYNIENVFWIENELEIDTSYARDFILEHHEECDLYKFGVLPKYKINLDNNKSLEEEINAILLEKYNNSLNVIEEYIIDEITTAIMTYNAELVISKEDILSFKISNYVFAEFGITKGRPVIYTINLNTGEEMTAKELIEFYNLDLDEVISAINNSENFGFEGESNEPGSLVEKVNQENINDIVEVYISSDNKLNFNFAAFHTMDTEHFYDEVSFEVDY